MGASTRRQPKRPAVATSASSSRGRQGTPDGSPSNHFRSCIEVRSARGTLLIIDCGTGGHSLAQKLVADAAKPLLGNILISHTHWDHIQGILPSSVYGRERMGHDDKLELGCRGVTVRPRTAISSSICCAAISASPRAESTDAPARGGLPRSSSPPALPTHSE